MARLFYVGVVLAGSLLALPACTRENPTTCLDGFCNDPRLPYCDADGIIEGTPGACIAVACEPLTFEACRGDEAISCNAAGDSYDTTQCERGCDPTAGGCRRCEPNQTTCTNGEVVTCDADGTVVAATPCALGCFEDEPRCRAIDPSNDLGQFLDMVINPPDVDITDGGFDTGAGTIGDSAGQRDVPSFLVPGSQGRPAIRVYVVNNIVIRGESAAYSTTDLSRVTGPALAIVARGRIEVRGSLVAGTTAGALATSSCYGGNAGHGTRTVAGVTQHLYVASAGGSHATRGGRGGGVTTLDFEGGPSANAVGTEELVPLHGGCNAGGANNAGMPTFVESGGGAVQLSSEVGIVVDGTINVSGGAGGVEQAGVGPGVFVYGGGAGGSILLEAPLVELTSNGRLVAKGGSGYAGTGRAPPVVGDDEPSPAVPCATVPATACGGGGSGAVPGIEPGDGGDATYVQQSSTTTFYGGGGGGGLGRARINTADGTYERSSESLEVADVTAGTVKTR